MVRWAEFYDRPHRRPDTLLCEPNLCEQIYQDGKDHIIAGSGPQSARPRLMASVRCMAVCKWLPERPVDRWELRDDGGPPVGDFAGLAEQLQSTVWITTACVGAAKAAMNSPEAESIRATT